MNQDKYSAVASIELAISGCLVLKCDIVSRGHNSEKGACFGGVAPSCIRCVDFYLGCAGESDFILLTGLKRLFTSK